MSKALVVASQQGNKETQGQTQTLLSPSLAKGTLTCLEEFKWGFPSAGLSVVSNKWWGSTSIDGYEFMFENENTKDKEELDGKELKKNEGTGILTTDRAQMESGKGAHGTGLLSSVRGSVVEEGREVHRLGFLRDFSLDKLETTEKKLLLQIFQSSLPR